MATTVFTLSSQLAEDLLAAWTSGDAARVQGELRRSMSVPAGTDDVGEEERRHLLKAVAERMRKSGDVFRKQDPVLEVCARLLEHLVE
jgi:hypothetical protein